MPRFKVGQEVVCVGDHWEYKGRRVVWVNDPKKGEIVVIAGYAPSLVNPYYVILQGRDSILYQEDAFEPLISDEVLADELKSIPEYVTA